MSGYVTVGLYVPPLSISTVSCKAKQAEFVPFLCIVKAYIGHECLGTFGCVNHKALKHNPAICVHRLLHHGAKSDVYLYC